MYNSAIAGVHLICNASVTLTDLALASLKYGVQSKHFFFQNTETKCHWEKQPPQRSPRKLIAKRGIPFESVCI